LVDKCLYEMTPNVRSYTNALQDLKKKTGHLIVLHFI